MREKKIRYTFEHVLTGNIEQKIYTLNQLEERTVKELSPCFNAEFGYKLIGRDDFTGLKDKNGKEIYEGDIVKYSFRDGNDINTRFMQIYNDGVNFKMKELHRDYWLEKIDGVLRIKHGHLTKYRGETNLLCDVSGLVVYWYEVIGNIHEHGHLLEGTA